MRCRTVLHGGVLPGGPPAAALQSDQLHHEAHMAAVYDRGDASSSLDGSEAEGEAHGWLISRSGPIALKSACKRHGMYMECLPC